MVIKFNDDEKFRINGSEEKFDWSVLDHPIVLKSKMKYKDTIFILFTSSSTTPSWSEECDDILFPVMTAFKVFETDRMLIVMEAGKEKEWALEDHPYKVYWGVHTLPTLRRYQNFDSMFKKDQVVGDALSDPDKIRRLRDMVVDTFY